jgi:hypothetical protein
VAVRLEELAQRRHGHLVLAADVDPAQEDEISGHRVLEDATKLVGGSALEPPPVALLH